MDIKLQFQNSLKMILSIEEGLLLKKQIVTSAEIIKKLNESVDIISTALLNGNKLLIAGNGGSASESQHFAAEIVGRFEKERKAYPAISLSCDSSIVTAISNDYGYEDVFARQIEGYGKAGDVFIGISTSGNSKNIINAITKARQNNLKVISFLGRDGGKMATLSDVDLIVPHESTARIQEIHMMFTHLICSAVEEKMV